MSTPDALREFCLGQQGAFLIPAEAVSPEGVAASAGEMLIAAGRLSRLQFSRLARGVALAWHRGLALHQQAPQWWFAPRAMNLLIVNEPAAVAPYMVPFAGSTAVIYLSDLGPADGTPGDPREAGPQGALSAPSTVSTPANPSLDDPHRPPSHASREAPRDSREPDPHAEAVAYLLLHNERLPLVGSLRGSHLANLSYWLTLGEQERAAFAKTAAGALAARPDGAAFSALARCFVWIDEAWQDPLRPPPRQPSQPLIAVAGTGLYVPRQRHGELAALCAAADSAQAGAVAAFRQPRPLARATTLDALCDWLRESRAHLDVVAPNGQPLWRAGDTDPSALRAALAGAAGVAETGVASLAADLAVVHERSMAFLGALRDPSCLPTVCALLEQGGSAWVDAARRTIVVPLRPSAFDPLREPAPPFHRLLLGARVVHEWGHLAHKAGLLRVQESERPRYREARRRLGEVFADVLTAVPPALAPAVQDELASLSSAPALHAAQAEASPAAMPLASAVRSSSAALSEALARKVLSRIGDYLANLLVARLVPAPEMQAYVRANVHHHLDEELGVVAEFARFAHEVHYLPLAGVPRRYAYDTARFQHDFIDTGVITHEAAERLFDAAGAVFACYAFDESAWRPGAAPPAATTAPPPHALDLLHATHALA